MSARDVLEDNKLIGEFVEEAVCRYFQDCGFEMIRFGVEHFFPESLLDLIRNDVGAALWPGQYEKTANKQLAFTEFLRSHPDFIAVHEGLYGKKIPGVFPVEVKFRTERIFPGNRRPLRTIRLSNARVEAYRTYWPSTILVVVCYKSKSLIATRIDKLPKTRDGRVPIAAYPGRGSWFYDIDSSDFRPLSSFCENVFDVERERAMVSEIVSFADEVRAEACLQRE